MQVSNNNQSYTNYNQYKEEIAKKLTEYAKNGDTEAIKKMVDEVVLSKVDSSSFDKYVEEMEGGKSSVADKFFSSLTKFIDDFVKNEEHFKYWLGALPFYDNVEREGVEIVG